MSNENSRSARAQVKCIGSSQKWNTEQPSNFLKSAQWSQDGSSIITADYRNNLNAFVLPHDIIEPDYQGTFQPFSTISSAEPIYSNAVYPYFSLCDSSTTLVLSSIRDHPLRLSNIIQSMTVCKYPLINPTTEKYISPHSLQFTRAGDLFITGSNSAINVFDISRDGDGPVESFVTIPSKRTNMVRGGVGMKGIVSALEISCDGVLAAGTFNRDIGLYANEGRGDIVAIFSVKDDDRKIAGNGITQVFWSSCGHYLYVAERLSDSILVYDMRMSRRRLAALSGRQAYTNQRMTAAYFNTQEGHSISAGGTDGITRLWNSPHLKEGDQMPVYAWESDTSTVCSVGCHPFYPIISTCSGEHEITNGRVELLFDTPDRTLYQTCLTQTSHLKLWTFY